MEDPRPYQPATRATQPPNLFAPYVSTLRRAPSQPLVPLAHTLTEVTGPALGAEKQWAGSPHKARAEGGEAIGQRIIVWGRVFDTWGRPLPRTLIEIWQANACGRYLHDGDQHDAPLDPHFTGRGAVVTDDEGCYQYVTIQPGSYPWGNHHNAWRPRHIHLSLFGPAFATRLVTQMYFPGDPLLPFDPIFNSVPDPVARDRLVARLDLERAIPDVALAYRFDVVLRGRERTPQA
jgi:protocatechuate 3,4-dioxygenase beta subunit